MTAKNILFTISLGFLMLNCSCDKDEPFATTPYVVDVSSSLPPLPGKVKQTLTQEGVKLGKKLFYEKRLSGDNTMSCNTCHKQEAAFATHNKVEKGITGEEGRRNSMPLFNLAYSHAPFFWDGRAKTLKEQVQMPVEDPIEMHETWSNAIKELKGLSDYVVLFKEAFDIEEAEINQEYAADAMAQFIHTIVSGNSKYDQFIRGEVDFTDDEIAGLSLFRIDGPVIPGTPNGADCFHCHVEPLFSDYLFHNNGLDKEADWKDLGLYDVTKLNKDKARFKTPSLRNIALTAPYMHDGRFNTLEEVLDHYNTGGHVSPTTSNLMEHQGEGLLLTELQKKQVIAFLKTLTDQTLVDNPKFKE
jgi:cytochrome c peroxidase